MLRSYTRRLGAVRSRKPSRQSQTAAAARYVFCCAMLEASCLRFLPDDARCPSRLDRGENPFGKAKELPVQRHIPEEIRIESGKGAKLPERTAYRRFIEPFNQ